MRPARRTPPTLLATLVVCAVTVQGYPCGWPGRPMYGRVTTRSQLFAPGETSDVTCEPGYVRFGLARRTCTSAGTWDSVMPFCRPNVAYQGDTLGPRSPLTQGQVTSLGEFDSGLTVDGDMDTCSRTPREIGERWWQVRLKSRTRVESVGLVVPSGYHLDVSIFVISLDKVSPERADYQQCANFSGVLYQAKQRFRCGNQGLTGEYVFIRDEKRHLDYLTLCEVEVFAFGDLRGCGDPEQPAHGHVSRPDADTATYRCQGGYRLAGHRQRRCNRGDWTGQQPVCRKIFCDRPPQLQNGHLDVAVPSLVRYPYNATAQYRCSDGFVMQGGSGLRTCAVTGRWRGAMPRCQPLVCPMPPRYENVRHKLLNGTTRWRAMAEYSCKEGFVIQPGSHVTLTQCDDSGSWGPVNLTCAPAVLTTQPDGSASTEHDLTVHHNEREPMSSGVVAGILVAAIIAIIAMIIVGIVFTRKRYGVAARKRPDPPSPAVPPVDVKTYDQVYEPSYQNVLQGPAPALLSFHAPSSQRSSGGEPRARPVEPPYETLKARLASSTPSPAWQPEEDPYEPIAGGRVYDDVTDERDSEPYQSLADREPDYETLRAQRSDHGGDYDLVPARPERASLDYDLVPGTYENYRFGDAVPPAEVPDLLKGASGQTAADIPPEILALYAKVVKSKKRNQDAGSAAETALPPAADSACPSSPSSSAASSYTRNLIDKFNRLAKTDEGTELPDQAHRPPRVEEEVQYTQIHCPTEGSGEVRRSSAEPVVYSNLRPLPPVPPEA